MKKSTAQRTSYKKYAKRNLSRPGTKHLLIMLRKTENILSHRVALFLKIAQYLNSFCSLQIK